MCVDPGTAMMISSVVADTAGQSQAAKMQNRMNAVQRQNILGARDANMAQVAMQQEQARASAQQDIHEERLRMTHAMATANAGAADKGVGGNSVEAMLADLAGRGARHTTSVEANYINQSNSIQGQLSNIDAQTTSALSALTPAAGPNYLTSALKIGSVGYADYQKQQAKR
jgi:hypothetical protein